jgi:hypothetical protein
VFAVPRPLAYFFAFGASVIVDLLAGTTGFFTLGNTPPLYAAAVDTWLPFSVDHSVT